MFDTYVQSLVEKEETVAFPQQTLDTIPASAAEQKQWAQSRILCKRKTVHIENIG